MCGRAQWPWRVLRTAGAAGVRVYFWARVRWVLGSSGVGAFCVRARLGSCCAGVFLLRSGPCCVARILGAVGRPPIYACGLGIWRRGIFCVRPRGLWPLAYSVCGQALSLGAWPVPLVGCILRTAAVCCVERIPGTAGAWRRGAYSGCGWAPLLLGVLSASGLSCLL